MNTRERQEIIKLFLSKLQSADNLYIHPIVDIGGVPCIGYSIFDNNDKKIASINTTTLNSLNEAYVKIHFKEGEYHCDDVKIAKYIVNQIEYQNTPVSKELIEV
jgi:hypothetical protein